MIKWLKRIGIAFGVIVLLGLALIGILSTTRGTPVRSVFAKGDPSGVPAVTDSVFARTMGQYTSAPVEPGNRIEVLANGNGTYPPLWRDLRAAKRTITVQMYYSEPGATADTMAAILIERARAGVRVLVLLDAFGSGPLKGEWTDRLVAGRVELKWLRPLHWYTLHKASKRSHARVVVVDGRVGYTGGFGLADYWQGDGRSKDHWRETNVRVMGPVVGQLQIAFAVGWAEAAGQLLTGDTFFPAIAFEERGPTQAALLHAMPSVGSTQAERFLALTISGARRTLYITNSYFVPDDDFRNLLVRASKRGVDVRVLTTGEETDIKSTLLAGRNSYEQLLAGGVRIYEYVPTMMHAKTIVADGIWSTIGSMNFDNRSLAFNNETNIVTPDPTVGAVLDSMFLGDLKFARERTLEEFKRRSLWQRAKENVAATMSRLL